MQSSDGPATVPLYLVCKVVICHLVHSVCHSQIGQKLPKLSTVDTKSGICIPELHCTLPDYASSDVSTFFSVRIISKSTLLSSN